LQDDGIHITPRKTAQSTGKSIIIEWSVDLKFAVDQVMKLRKKILSLWLFHTNRGQPYMKENGAANGFDSVWQRFMAKALKFTELQERFTEHDLRAKVASDTGSEHAKQLLGHSSSEITNRVYRKKPELIRPAK
jgi:integrase